MAQNMAQSISGFGRRIITFENVKRNLDIKFTKNSALTREQAKKAIKMLFDLQKKLNKLAGMVTGRSLYVAIDKQTADDELLELQKLAQKVKPRRREEKGEQERQEMLTILNQYIGLPQQQGVAGGGLYVRLSKALNRLETVSEANIPGTSDKVSLEGARGLNNSNPIPLVGGGSVNRYIFSRKDVTALSADLEIYLGFVADLSVHAKSSQDSVDNATVRAGNSTRLVQLTEPGQAALAKMKAAYEKAPLRVNIQLVTRHLSQQATTIRSDAQVIGVASSESNELKAAYENIVNGISGAQGEMVMPSSVFDSVGGYMVSEQLGSALHIYAKAMLANNNAEEANVFADALRDLAGKAVNMSTPDGRTKFVREIPQNIQRLKAKMTRSLPKEQQAQLMGDANARGQIEFNYALALGANRLGKFQNETVKRDREIAAREAENATKKGISVEQYRMQQAERVTSQRSASPGGKRAESRKLYMGDIKKMVVVYSKLYHTKSEK